MSARFLGSRVPLVDPRTGLITREWYLFFQAIMDPGASADADQALLYATGGGIALEGDSSSADDPTIAAVAVPSVDPAEELERPHIPADLTLDEFLAILGYVPANRAGDTFTGPITAPTITSTGAVIATTTISSAASISAVTSIAAGTTMTAATLISTGGITAAALPTFATDVAAGAGGLVSGQFYKTATGELRIKL